MTRDEAYRMLRGVREELDAARYALLLSETQWAGHRVLSGLTYPAYEHLRVCQRNLELTYFLRLFSTFEAVLRSFWTSSVRNSRPDLKALLDSVATRRRVDDSTRDAVHDLRDFRNDIMHRNASGRSSDFATAIKALGLFLSWLPLQW